MNNNNNNNETGTDLHNGVVVAANKKRTRGRQKIEMKKINENSQLQVTFSKRRHGLFKKASELSVLTGAEIAIIVNSPGKHVFAFGHPTVDSVVDKYIIGSSDMAGDTKLSNPTMPSMIEFNEQYSEILRQSEAEKKRREMILQSKKESEVHWWDEPIEGLGIDELELYLASMEELKKKILIRADEIRMIKSSSMANFDVNNGVNSDNLFMFNSSGIPVLLPHDFHSYFNPNF